MGSWWDKGGALHFCRSLWLWWAPSCFILCKLCFLLISQVVSVPGLVRPWDGVGGVSSAASQTCGIGEGAGACRWVSLGVSRLCWGGWLHSPGLENGSESWVSRCARWEVPKSPHPLALPSSSPSGELALGWIWLLLGHLKSSCGSRASKLTEDKLSPAGAGCPWYPLMLAPGEHPTPALEL